MLRQIALAKPLAASAMKVDLIPLFSPFIHSFLATNTTTPSACQFTFPHSLGHEKRASYVFFLSPHFKHTLRSLLLVDPLHTSVLPCHEESHETHSLLSLSLHPIDGSPCHEHCHHSPPGSRCKSLIHSTRIPNVAMETSTKCKCQGLDMFFWIRSESKRSIFQDEQTHRNRTNTGRKRLFRFCLGY